MFQDNIYGMFSLPYQVRNYARTVLIANTSPQRGWRFEKALYNRTHEHYQHIVRSPVVFSWTSDTIRDHVTQLYLVRLFLLLHAIRRFGDPRDIPESMLVACEPWDWDPVGWKPYESNEARVILPEGAPRRNCENSWGPPSVFFGPLYRVV